MRSIQPVFDAQVGHFFEVREVPCQHGGIVFERDACDAEVHGADVHLPAPQAVKDVRRIIRPRQQKPLRDSFEAVLKIVIGADTAITLMVRLNLRKPALQHFLCGHDSQKAFVARISQPLHKASANHTFLGELPVVIGVKNEHSVPRWTVDSFPPATQPPSGLHRQSAGCLSCVPRFPSKLLVWEHGGRGGSSSPRRQHIVHPWSSLGPRLFSCGHSNGHPSGCQSPFPCARFRHSEFVIP